jgi:hypothetical protein
MTLPAGFMVSGQEISFTLQLTSAGGDRTHSTSVRITATAASASLRPVVRIVNTRPLVAPHERVVLEGRVLSQSATPLVGLHYTWTVDSLPAGVAPFDCAAAASLAGLANRANLLLARGVLAPGSWTFRLAVALAAPARCFCRRRVADSQLPGSHRACLAHLQSSYEGAALLFDACINISSPHTRITHYSNFFNDQLRLGSNS